MLRYLAFAQISSHLDDHRENIVGSTCKGPGLLQIVALDCFSLNEQELASLPRLSLAIRHQGALAWDIKWCSHQNPPFAGPAPRSASSSLALSHPASKASNASPSSLSKFTLCASSASLAHQVKGWQCWMSTCQHLLCVRHRPQAASLKHTRMELHRPGPPDSREGFCSNLTQPAQLALTQLQSTEGIWQM